MALINPKPRFGYDPETDAVYDYVKQKDVALTTDYAAGDGVWDLIEVKRLILAGLTVEGARRDLTAAELSPPSSAPEPAITGLTGVQLTALKLSAVQAAALGLTPIQISVTGVTATQVRAWALTAARAEALKLTSEQRAVLLP